MNPWGLGSAPDALEFDFPEFVPDGPIRIDVLLSLFPEDAELLYKKEIDILHFLTWWVFYSVLYLS